MERLRRMSSIRWCVFSSCWVSFIIMMSWRSLSLMVLSDNRANLSDSCPTWFKRSPTCFLRDSFSFVVGVSSVSSSQTILLLPSIFDFILFSEILRCSVRRLTFSLADAWSMSIHMVFPLSRSSVTGTPNCRTGFRNFWKQLAVSKKQGKCSPKQAMGDDQTSFNLKFQPVKRLVLPLKIA